MKSFRPRFSGDHLIPYHEASHAAVGIVHGCDVALVVLYDTPLANGRTGETFFRPRDTPDVRDVLARVQMAGPAGERIGIARNLFPARKGNASDRVYAQHATEFNLSKAEAYRASAEAAAILEHEWEFVDTLACALFARRRIDGAGILSIARQTMRGDAHQHGGSL